MNPRHRPWPAADLAELRVLYPQHTNAELGRRYGRSPQAVAEKAYALGLYKSPEHLANHAGRLHDSTVGVASRFQRGSTPWNKGLPFHAGGRSAETRFGPGNRPHTWLPVGTLRITKDGYLQRKISDTGYPPRDWIAVHRLVWEAVHGPMPDGHVVVFRAGRHTCVVDDITVDGVELISRAELMVRNSVHRHGAEVARLSQLKGAVQRQINRIDRAARPAAPSPETTTS